jgi:SAM-dependent methyltransferase
MDDATLQFYRDNAQSYADWVKAPSARLVRFMGLLPAGGEVLELGCGAGNHSAAMWKAGFVVRSTDGSPEMAEVASRRLGQPVETMLFHELDAHEAYDGVWASACLLHAPRDELSGILGRIHRALKSAGLFYASFKVGENDGRDSLGRYYNYVSREWLEAAYARAGRWQFIATDTSEIKSFDGEPATMLHFMVRKG